jgi:hypothetical protein
MLIPVRKLVDYLFPNSARVEWLKMLVQIIECCKGSNIPFPIGNMLSSFPHVQVAR